MRSTIMYRYVNRNAIFRCDRVGNRPIGELGVHDAYM